MTRRRMKLKTLGSYTGEVWKEVEEEEHSWDAWGDSEPGCVSPGDLHHFYFSSLEEFARVPRSHRPDLASWLAAHKEDL